jgi:hypothetical protein
MVNAPRSGTTRLDESAKVEQAIATEEAAITPTSLGASGLECSGTSARTASSRFAL